MTKRDHNAHSGGGGFTLVETIVALAVSTIVVLGMTQVFISGVRHVQIVRADTALSANVSHMVQRLTHEVHRAEEVSVSGTTVTILHHDSTSIDITHNGSSMGVEMDGNPLTEVGIVSVSTFTPEKVGDSLHIAFILEAGTHTVRTFDGQITLTPRK